MATATRKPRKPSVDRGRIHAPTIAILFVALVLVVGTVAVLGYGVFALLTWASVS